MATTMTQRLPKPVSLIGWIAVIALGTFALAAIALNRGESIDAMWFIVAAVCVYALGYRFYSAFLAAKVFALDPTRATPAERFSDGRDFMPTNRWIVFGHHFAAIAGPGPADRADARGAVRLPARHAVDPDRRRARRLRAGFRRVVLLDPPRRPLARPDGARRARPDRRRRRTDRRHGHHDHPDRRARPRRRQRDAAQPVGHVDGRRDDPDRRADRPLHAASTPGPSARRHGDRRGAAAGRRVRRRLDRRSPDAARVVRLRRARRSR